MDGRPLRLHRSHPLLLGRATIARNQNTFAKREREMNKKAKADAKRARRKQKKLRGDAGQPPEPLEVEPTSPDESALTS